jgi:putative DNA primase/helicase
MSLQSVPPDGDRRNPATSYITREQRSSQQTRLEERGSPPGGAFSPERSPEELRERRQWVNWRWTWRDGRWTKEPLNPNNGHRAKSDKPSTWSDYETAVRRWKAREDVAGVGFVFTEADPYCGLDYDDCRDPVTGELHPQVAADLESLGGYAEWSPSGKGIKAIIRARKPGDRCRTSSVPWGGEFEMYDRGRFFTITGHVLDGHDLVTDGQEALEEIYERSFPPQADASPPPRSSGGSPLEDEELLKKARNSRDEAGFRKLYDQGDTAGYPSHSEADFALLRRLAFWTALDPVQTKRLFMRSALYREEKGDDYVDRSVAACILKYRGKVYDPKGAAREAREKVLAGMWAPLFTEEWMGMSGATDHDLYCGLLIEATERGIPRREGSINVTPGQRGLAKIAGTSLPTANAGLKRLKERGLVDILPKTRARARDVIVIKAPQVLNTRVHTRAGGISVQDLWEFGALLKLRWGRDARATFQRVGKVSGLVLHWLLVFKQGLSAEVLAECIGRRKDAVVLYLERLEATGLVTRSGDLWRLPADFWERLAAEIEDNCATSERLQEQSANRAEEAEEYWSSPEAPEAGGVPPEPDEEWLRRAGWQPVWVWGQKRWRHPKIRGLPLHFEDQALALQEAHGGRIPPRERKVAV